MTEYKNLNDYEIMYMVAENDESAQDVMFKKYYPIVNAIAVKNIDRAKKCGIELEDLMQEGYIGLYNAIKHYRDDKNTMFYTYVVLSIKSKILNYIKIQSSAKNNVLNNSISLNSSVYLEDDVELMETVKNDNSIDPKDDILNIEFSSNLKNFLYSQEIMLASIFELKMNGFSQREISELLDISNQLVSKNWIKLKKSFNSFFVYI